MDLKTLGWNDFFSSSFAADAGLAPGRVASENRGHFSVWTATGESEAILPGNGMDYPVTGDWVALDQSRVIRALLPRRTKVSRKRAGRTWQEQVLAANVDVLFLVAGLDGDYNPRRLERYLMVAQQSGARPVVVLNKSDLCDDPLARLRTLDTLAPGVAVVLTCALDGQAASQLHRFVEPGETAVLLGSSGVGKSTLVNSLLNDQRQTVHAVRESDGRGMHTTSGRQLFRLPQGWLLIDTPGLREIEPWASAETAEAVFVDVQEVALQCRFRDCRHAGEPGCAVAAALDQGALDQARFESFRKLRREMDRLERMSDPNAARKYKSWLKKIHKARR
ncbi:MAG: ribosome small subunit-dependent GTPase A [Acidobacteria bacterium]|nr:ribosome small subunit-dependent GTPase A [Acidobacteriota bacterium]